MTELLQGLRQGWQDADLFQIAVLIYGATGVGLVLLAAVVGLVQDARARRRRTTPTLRLVHSQPPAGVR